MLELVVREQGDEGSGRVMEQGDHVESKVLQGDESRVEEASDLRQCGEHVEDESRLDVADRHGVRVHARSSRADQLANYVDDPGQLVEPQIEEQRLVKVGESHDRRRGYHCEPLTQTHDAQPNFL